MRTKVEKRYRQTGRQTRETPSWKGVRWKARERSKIDCARRALAEIIPEIIPTEYAPNDYQTKRDVHLQMTSSPSELRERRMSIIGAIFILKSDAGERRFNPVAFPLSPSVLHNMNLSEYNFDNKNPGREMNRFKRCYKKRWQGKSAIRSKPRSGYKKKRSWDLLLPEN